VTEVFPLAVGRAASFAVPSFCGEEPQGEDGMDAETSTVLTATPRRGPLYGLICADAISMNGNAIAALAIPWFVLATTGSAARTGIAAAAGLIPFVLAAFFGGVIVDRLPHRRVSIIADLASMVSVALIPLLHALDLLNFGLLLALVFLGALLDTPGATARAALLPDLARSGKMRLERANAVHEIVESGAQLSGPIMAGLLIAATSAEVALWLNAASFAVSALLVGVLVPATTRVAGRVTGRYVAELVDGLRFVLTDPPIRSIFLSALALNFLISPLLAVVLPYYVNTVVGNAAVLGLVIAGFGGGAVLGAVAYGAIGHRLPRRGTFVTGVFAIGSAIGVLALLPPAPVMIAAMFLGGLISGPNGPLVSTVLQERTPAALRGRVFGASTAVGFAAAPAGVLLVGVLLETAGVQPALLGMTAVFLAVAVALALDRGLPEMNVRADGD
jgi:MFS family permease